MLASETDRQQDRNVVSILVPTYERPECKMRFKGAKEEEETCMSKGEQGRREGYWQVTFDQGASFSSFFGGRGRERKREEGIV